ncbi:MAG: hypothetical protein ACOCT7_02705 [Candidatus Saliniplasma sp.]
MDRNRKLNKYLTSDEEIIYQQDLTFRASAIGKIALTMVIVLIFLFFLLKEGADLLFYILLPIFIVVGIGAIIWTSLTKKEIYATDYRLIKTVKGVRGIKQFEEVPYDKINGVSFKTIWDRKVIAIPVLIVVLPFVIALFVDDIWNYLEFLIYIDILALIAMFGFSRESKLVIKIAGGEGLTGTSDLVFIRKGKAKMQTTVRKIITLVQEMRIEKEESIEEDRSTDEELIEEDEKKNGGAESTQEEIYCINCGTPNDPENEFCQSCSERMDGTKIYSDEGTEEY